MHPQPFSTVRISQVHTKLFSLLSVALSLRFIKKNLKIRGWKNCSAFQLLQNFTLKDLNVIFEETCLCCISLWQDAHSKWQFTGNKLNIFFCVFVVEGKREKEQVRCKSAAYLLIFTPEWDIKVTLTKTQKCPITNGQASTTQNKRIASVHQPERHTHPRAHTQTQQSPSPLPPNKQWHTVQRVDSPAWSNLQKHS